MFDELIRTFGMGCIVVLLLIGAYQHFARRAEREEKRRKERMIKEMGQERLKGLSTAMLRRCLENLYCSAEVEVANQAWMAQYDIAVRFPDCSWHQTVVTRRELEVHLEGEDPKKLWEFLDEKLGHPRAKTAKEALVQDAPPSGVREPYTCGLCGAPIEPTVLQCPHCKSWLVAAV